MAWTPPFISSPQPHFQPCVVREGLRAFGDSEDIQLSELGNSCARVQRGLSAARVSSWRGWGHEAKNGRKLEVVYKLRPSHHTDMTSKWPLRSSDSIKIPRLNLESKFIGLEGLTKYMQYWKQRVISALAKEVKTILAIRRFTYELSSNLLHMKEYLVVIQHLFL